MRGSGAAAAVVAREAAVAEGWEGVVRAAEDWVAAGSAAAAAEGWEGVATEAAGSEAVAVAGWEEEGTEAADWVAEGWGTDICCK